METMPFDVIKTEKMEVWSVKSLIRLVAILKIVFQMKQKISTFFIKLLIPKTRPVTAGIVYRPSNTIRNTARQFKLAKYVKQ